MPGGVVLTVPGGLLYTAGAIVRYETPGLYSVFGYHEVWHAFIVVASLCHFSMVLLLVTG
jgi:hemolysin III